VGVETDRAAPPPPPQPIAACAMDAGCAPLMAALPEQVHPAYNEASRTEG
jgi:hypothetical protein